MSSSPTFEDAILLARSHRSQKDKAGQSYVLHVLRVMFKLVTDEESCCWRPAGYSGRDGCYSGPVEALGYSDRIVGAVGWSTWRRE